MTRRSRACWRPPPPSATKDALRALGEGILAGLGIAVPVGPIAVLLIDLGIRRGFTAALPAGLRRSITGSPGAPGS